jgi:hypothetical protein
VFSYLERTFNIQDEQLNENARNIKKGSTKEQLNSGFPVYSNETIKPYALWSTKVGPGSKPYELA